MSTLTEQTKREIGQHFVFGFHGHEVSGDIKTLIKDYHLGSVILMKRNIQDAKQTKRIIMEMQILAKESGHKKPLLIGIDQENGLVSAFSSPTAGTQFPGAMAMAAAGSLELAEQISAASSRELKLVGINWAYSPVADVNSDSRNPVIGVRSFGDDPKAVGEYVNAVNRGLTMSGVAPSAKHFPGHGDTHVDSHLALPRILKSKEELLATEIVPFRSLIENGVATIMTGHMALPLVTGDDTPCSLSRAITTDLLKKELGYKGVVVTDCLEMDAIAEPEQGGCGVEEGAVRAIAAGADVVMVCHTMSKQRGAVEAVYEALRGGRLDLDEIMESGEKVGLLKDRFVGGWDDVLKYDDIAFGEIWRDLKSENEKLSERAYGQSIALVRDKAGVLPLKTGGKVVLFTPKVESLNKAVDDADGVLRTPDGKLRNTAGGSFLALAGSVGERASCKHIVYSADGAVEEVGVGDGVVFVTRNADRSRWQTEYLGKVLGRGAAVVVLASCAPYDLVGSKGMDEAAYIASFEFTAAALEAAARVVFGEAEPRGRVPVLGGQVI